MVYKWDLHVVKFRGQSQDEEAKTWSVSPMSSHEEAWKLHKHVTFNLYYCLILWLHADGSSMAESIMFSLHTNLSIEVKLQVHLTGIVHKELSFRVSKSWAVPTTSLKSTLSHCLHFVFTSCSALYCASFLSFILQRWKHLSCAELWFSELRFHTTQDRHHGLTYQK